MSKAATAAPSIPYGLGSTVTIRHPGFSGMIKGKVIRHYANDHMLVESPDGFRLYTHHKYTLEHTPDLLGEIGESEPNRDASDHRSDEAGEEEPVIVPERYYAILRSWCENHHH